MATSRRKEKAPDAAEGTEGDAAAAPKQRRRKPRAAHVFAESAGEAEVAAHAKMEAQTQQEPGNAVSAERTHTVSGGSKNRVGSRAARLLTVTAAHRRGACSLRSRSKMEAGGRRRDTSLRVETVTAACVRVGARVGVRAGASCEQSWSCWAGVGLNFRPPIVCSPAYK